MNFFFSLMVVVEMQWRVLNGVCLFLFLFSLFVGGELEYKKGDISVGGDVRALYVIAIMGETI